MGNKGIRVSTPKEDIEPPERDLIVWRIRHNRYHLFLKTVKGNVEARFKANDLPKGKLADYEILGFLAEGTYGKVLQVAEKSSDHTFAMKVQMRKRLHLDRCIQRVITEKKLHRAMKHRFICTASCAFQDQLNLYLVLPIMEYGALSRVCGDEHKASEKCIMYMAAQMVLGIEYMHCANIVHRDLKPANILINHNYYLKISDLGFARFLDDRAFTIHGTPCYMAPEILKGSGYGKAVDWWSLGVIVFELAYGHLPRLSISGPRVPVFPLAVEEREARRSFIEALLVEEPGERLGSGGTTAELVKNHPYFYSVYFYDLEDKRVHFEGNMEHIVPDESKDFDDLFEISQDLPNPNPFAEY